MSHDKLPPVDDAISRKEQIYLTAGKLFAEVGYHAASMRDLAKKLGVQGGSLYAHITSKEELLWEIVNWAADEFDRALEPIRDSSQDPASKLRSALEAHMQVIERNLDWATVFFHEWKHLSDDKLERIAARRDKIERIFRQILEEGVRKGVFRASLDVKLAGVLALSSANWAYHWFNPQGRFTAREVADAFAQMLLEGMRK